MRIYYRIFAIIFVCFSAITASAQLVAVEVESVVMHTGATDDGVDLTGYTTYRMYAVLTNEEDFVSSVFGIVDSPMNISTTTSFWQSPFGSNVGSSINPGVIAAIPSVAFDSWVTIGRENSGDLGNDVSALQSDTEPWLTTFSNGQNIVIDGAIGGAWFTLYGVTAVNGFAGPDLRVLIGQFTTDGMMSGSVNVQVFVNGDQSNSQIGLNFPLTFVGDDITGCTESAACNYNPDATQDDGSCEYLSCCEAEAGNLSITSTTCVDDGGNAAATYITSPVIPDGYAVGFVLTQGPELVIVDFSTEAAFSGLEAGSYTMHSFVYPADLADDILALIEFGVTTGGEVNALLAQGGGTLCAALDVTGAMFVIAECEDVLGCTDPLACNYNPDATVGDGSCDYLSCCEADAGALQIATVTCVDEGGAASATVVNAPSVPDGYVVSYVLTQGAELVIIDLNDTPDFSDLALGTYTIHTFVYPADLDLSIVQLGVTTGVEVNALLAQGGGTVCAALDVSGAAFDIEECQVEIEGCTNPTACNYNPAATNDNFSCLFVGNACDDGDATTENDVITEDCVCAGTPIEEEFDCIELEANIGDACDDGDATTENDVITEDCECAGMPIEEEFDCIELEANIGDPCDDQDDETVNDVITEDCDCEGTPSNVEEHFFANVRVFPNPASNELTVDLGDIFVPVMATLTDISGRIVMSEQLIGRSVISVDGLATGMYILMLETPTVRTEMKIMVNR